MFQNLILVLIKVYEIRLLYNSNIIKILFKVFLLCLTEKKRVNYEKEE